MGSIIGVWRQKQASQIQPNYGRNQFVPQLVTGKMIIEQKSNRALKGVKRSIPIKKIDAGKKIVKIKSALNNSVWTEATRPLLDGGKNEHSVNNKFQWESRRRPRRHVSKVECVGITRVLGPRKRIDSLESARCKVNIESL